ncbi:MAG: hypothetical protein M5U28_21820 [Sandaracinaceae bacterium]|nr:hypothetical protein [Sandaracinaceae bacterium]
MATGGGAAAVHPQITNTSTHRARVMPPQNAALQVAGKPQASVREPRRGPRGAAQRRLDAAFAPR